MLSSERESLTFQWEGLSPWECGFQNLFFFHSCKKCSEIRTLEVGMWRVSFPRFFCSFSLIKVQPHWEMARLCSAEVQFSWPTLIACPGPQPWGRSETQQAHTVIVTSALSPPSFWTSYFLCRAFMLSLPLPLLRPALSFPGQTFFKIL